MLSPRTSGPVNPGHPLNRARVAWWLAVPWAQGGPRWFDILGTSQATLGSTTAWRPTPRPGGSGHLNFDGTINSRATVANFALLGNLPGLTVAAWVCTPTGNTNIPGLIGVAGSFTLTLFGGAGRNASFTPTNQAGSSASVQTSSPVVVAGAWHRIVGTWDGSTARLYVDGLLSNSGALSGTATGPATSAYLGGINAGSQVLTGALDDVAIWSRPISATEVRADYDLSQRGYPGPLNYDDQATGFPAAFTTASSNPTPTLGDWAMDGGFQAMGY